MPTATFDRPIRAAVFNDLGQAERAVHDLSEHGFSDDQITVVCSDRETETHFRQYEHQEPAGFYTTKATLGGAAFGAALGLLGAFLLVALFFPMESIVFVIAALAALTGAVAGGFFGAMMTRGVEKELADFYDQDVPSGKILVAVEDYGKQAKEHLAEAVDVLTDAGSKAIELPEG